MANSLGKMLEGKKVLMEGNQPEEFRTRSKKGAGFGAMPFTSGTALFVKDHNGTSLKMNAMEVERIIDE